MTIKQAAVLACTDGVHYAQFRNVDDVDNRLVDVELAIKTRLRQLASLNKKMPETAAHFLAVFSHPSVSYNRHLEVLAELFDKVDQLISIHGMLIVSFSSMPKARPLIKRVEDLIEYSKTKVSKALAGMSAGVEKYQPEHFARSVVGVARQISKYANHYESMAPLSMMRVIEDKDGNVLGTQFSTYLCFAGLKDAKGYVHAKYHIVLSCIVDKYGKFSMNYALQPTLVLPGKFRSTDSFSSVKGCMSQIVARMNEEGFDWR